MRDIYSWLLEDKNPAVQYRTRTELLDQNADVSDARNWILARLPERWWEIQGLWYRYYLTAIAECGLTYHELTSQQLDPAFAMLAHAFEHSCADFMLLNALVKLRLGNHPIVSNALSQLNPLSDGGFLCRQRQRKLNYIPKSCYKANVHALMLAANCKMHEIDAPFTMPLADYFVRRNLFYRTDSPETLVLDARPGWRSIDAFHPFEAMRVGIHNILEAMCTLGFGQHPALNPAWELLNRQKDAEGRILLAGTLTKSYLPKERIGQPSKWATFYTLLAEKYRNA